jgi:hypothetical protein
VGPTLDDIPHTRPILSLCFLGLEDARGAALEGELGA